LPLQDAWFDSYQVFEPRSVKSKPAVVVEIDDASLARLGQWPWPRTLLAELIRKIASHEPRAIGVDILMPEPDRLSPERLLASARQLDPLLASRLGALPSTDTELARAITDARVVLALAGTPERTSNTLRTVPITVRDTAPHAPGATSAAPNVVQFLGVATSFEELDRAATGHGLITAESRGAVIRRVSLVSSVNGTLAPALAIEMLRVGYQAPALRLLESGSTPDTVSFGKFDIPTEQDGAIRIYYAARNPVRSVSAVDVLEGKVDPSRLREKLVVIGAVGLALSDWQNTPLGVAMPGSEIQAQLLENLIDQTWLARPPWAAALELALFVLLGLSLIWVTPRWTPRHAALLAGGSVIAGIVAAYAAFHWQRLLFDAATPALGSLLLFAVLLALTLADETRRRKSLERVVQAQREQAAYIDGELQAARRIQTGILPRGELLGDDTRVDLAAKMAPAREVGGDLYDFFPLDGRRLFFLIGDVAGKGLSASIFMAVSKALYKSTTLRTPDAGVSELMRIANNEVSRDNPEMFFVTAFAGVLDLETGALTYCNAGHENPYLLDLERASVARLEGGGGPPLCTVEQFAYSGASYPMRSGEMLCLVTDGVLDAQNPTGERYGSERLQELLVRMRGSATTARGLVDAIAADIAAFVRGAEPVDDITVLALRWIGQ
jgi:serine phosphatase RsbU (regulator of sigma subunit)